MKSNEKTGALYRIVQSWIAWSHSTIEVNEMKLWFAQRSEEIWGGGLIISAIDEQEVIKLYKEHEHHSTPYHIKELNLDSSKVLYDDDMR